MLGCSVMGCLMMGRFVWEPYEDIWLLGKIGFLPKRRFKISGQEGRQ